MTSAIASVTPIHNDGAMVALSCGHQYYLAAQRFPRVGDPQPCWRCEQEQELAA